MVYFIKNPQLSLDDLGVTPILENRVSRTAASGTLRRTTWATGDIFMFRKDCIYLISVPYHTCYGMYLFSDTIQITYYLSTSCIVLVDLRTCQAWVIMGPGSTCKFGSQWLAHLNMGKTSNVFRLPEGNSPVTYGKLLHYLDSITLTDHK